MHPHPPLHRVHAFSPVGAALRMEHRALSRSVSALRASLDGAFDWEDARHALQALLLHLERHFEFEEEGGYMDSVLDIAPFRTPDVERVRDDHQALLERFEALVVESLTDPGRDAFQAHVEAALDALADHERRENQLVLETLLKESGGD